jgi:hypothetical protein
VGKRSTRQEVNERELEVADYLLRFPMASEFELHKEFCPKYSVHWSRINAYALRAKAINKKRVSMPPEDYKALGQAVLLDLLKSPSPMIRLKAEQSLREIAGYSAPRQTQIGGMEGKPLEFVPLTVNPDDVTGKK